MTEKASPSHPEATQLVRDPKGHGIIITTTTVIIIIMIVTTILPP